MEEQKQTAMEERVEATGSEWKDRGDGYFVLEGDFFAKVIYVAIPKSHKLVGSSYSNLDIEVNGGITFAQENVFGWDYGHYGNSNDYEGDISRAIEYFKSSDAVYTDPDCEENVGGSK